MYTFQKIGVAALVFLCVLATTISYLKFIPQSVHTSNIQSSRMSVRDTHITPNHFSQDIKNQRDELSRQLNEMKKLYGQQSCNFKKLEKKLGKSTDARYSENGGWCQETSRSNSSSHLFDKGLATALSKFFKGKNVASFGDGPGDYKKEIDRLKEVASYTAYDGAPFCEKTTEGRVNFLDFTAPIYGISTFDWVISIEVGEHIPQQFEDTFLDNLARHARDGIVLSWAVPGQPGLSHVNNQPLEHVIEQMKKRGFKIYKEEGKVFREASSFSWLKKNIHIYRREEGSSLKQEFA